MLIRSLAFVAVLFCASCGHFRTEYDGSALDPSTYSISEVVISVPDTLTVSEAEVAIPDADIVWRDEPRGDRRAQVRAIFMEAAEPLPSYTTGPTAVRLEIVVRRFHGLTKIARSYGPGVGVHNILFDVRLVATASNRVLVEEKGVKAALRGTGFDGPSGQEDAYDPNAERSRIVLHLRQVLSGWLRLTPATRTEFFTFGG